MQSGQGNGRKGAGWTREREEGCRVDKGTGEGVQGGQGNGRKGAGWTREREERCRVDKGMGRRVSAAV